MSEPRATLRIRTPSRIFASAAALIMPFVASVVGMCSVRKSAAA